MNSIVQRRKGKVKLMKDLKYGKIHLRQSLIEMNEFQDLTKIFNSRKQLYSIADHDVQVRKHETQQNEEQIPLLLSPQQRIEMYRRQKLNKKMKEKINKIYEEKEKIVNKMRKPKTTKLLDEFQTKYRNEMHISYKDQLRQSQINLENIKKNNKRKFEYGTLENGSKRMSRSRKSRIKQNSIDENSCLRSNSASRNRFLSLKTSLPQKQKEKILYPSVRQMIQGRYQNEKQKPSFDIKIIDNICDTFITQKQLRKNKSKIEKEIYEDKNQRNQGGSAMKKKAMTALDFERKDQKQIVDKCFVKSEYSSKDVIETMSQFYESKHSKKTEYDEMVDNLKYDRPLTSNIRRKNYKVIGKQSLSSIKKYRNKSEHERVNMIRKNHEFYMTLIDGLQNYHQQDIPTTIFIVEHMKDIFQKEYEFTLQCLNEIIASVKSLPVDICTQEILEKISNFCGYNIKIQKQ